MRRFLPILVLTICAGFMRADTLYVKPGYYTSIQSAINDANHGDTIIVDPCTYYENINFLGRVITLTSLDPNNPEIVADTIIDGSQPTDPNIGSVVTFSNGEGSNSVLTGFTITGGTGSWLQVFWEFKGYLWNRCGGGILCYDSSSPTITKNVITNNLAGQGGGVYFYDYSHPLILENTIIDNNAVINHGFEDPDPCDSNVYDHGDGGAIVGFQYCDATISGNLIEGNYARFYGGGIHLRQWSDGLIIDNLVTQNISALGAGIHVTYTSSPFISNNTISYNEASALGGGGIYVYYLSNPIIERNLIMYNVSTNGAGIGAYYTSNPTIRNNLIISNIDGAGVRIVGGAWADISNNTIVGNTASNYTGGGIECYSSNSSTIENNIIALNGQAHGIYVPLGQAIPLVRYNNVWANPAGNYNTVLGEQTGLNGNISLNPCFIGEDNNDFHLNYDSPCINSGDPNYKLEPTEVDFDGSARYMGQYIDIGAYEAWPVWNLTSGQKYAQIQPAIDSANDFDKIIVTPDRYYENLNFNGKNIELLSTEPNNSSIVNKTIIDGNNIDTVVTFEYGENANCTLRGFTITGGYASSGYGGGVRIRNFSNPTIKNNVIKNNQAGKGAGICLYHSSSKVLGNLIYSNTGAGVSQGGGMMIIDCLSDPNAVIANNIIAGNIAYYAGGIRIQNSTAEVINNTIVCNRAHWEGIGVYAEADEIFNCIVWENKNIGISGTGSPLYQCSAEYSCVDANIPGQGNIVSDPNFVNIGYWDVNGTPGNLDDDFFIIGNYHLLPDSPCVNAGDNNSVPPEAIYDIDREQRIFDDVVDMGADEVVTNPFDLNTNGIVGLDELLVLASEWLLDGAGLQADFYDDDFVDFQDFALLAEHWLWKGGWYE